MELVAFIFILGGFVVIIFVTRLFGAWMFRIDEVIKNQRLIINELKKNNSMNEIKSENLKVPE